MELEAQRFFFHGYFRMNCTIGFMSNATRFRVKLNKAE